MVMDCKPPRGISPSSDEINNLSEKFSNLKKDEWSKTGEATGVSGKNAYNCYAWSLCRDDVGWIEQIVDALGNNNKSLDVDDFDNFFSNKGYSVCGNSISDCKSESGKRKIALFGIDGRPTHAAKESDDDGWWESKLGGSIRILHRVEQLEGTSYGLVCRCYCKSIVNTSTHKNKVE